MSVDPPQPLPAGPPANDSQFPRLSIRHWFIGTLLCGVMFMLMQAQPHTLEFIFDLPRSPPMLRFGHAAVWAAEALVALLLLGLITARRSVNGFYPGHWLCLYSAVVLLSNTVSEPDWVGGGSFAGIRAYWLQSVLSRVLTCAVLFSPAILARPPLLWSIYFRLAFGLQIVRLLVMIRGESELNSPLARAEEFLLVAAALAFCVVFVIELIRRRRMDWAHWVGVFSPPTHFVLYQIEKYFERC